MCKETIDLHETALIVTVSRDGVCEARGNGGLNKLDAAFYLRAVADEWEREGREAGEIRNIPEDAESLAAHTMGELADKMDDAGLLRPAPARHPES